jgi:hypothetical protein
MLQCGLSKLHYETHWKQNVEKREKYNIEVVGYIVQNFYSERQVTLKVV